MKNLIKRMIVTIAVLTAIEFAIFSIFFTLKDALGVLIGGTGAVLNLMSLWKDVEKIGNSKKSKKGFYSRYAFNAAIFLVGGLISIKALIGVFIGLLNLKLSAFIIGLRGE